MNSRGFTLVEVMVATALFGVLTAGGLAAFSKAHGAWRTASAESQLHERAQYVFASLEPETQMAGYFGAGPVPRALDTGSIPAPARSCGATLVGNLDRPVEVFAAYTLPCAARGGAVAGSQVLVLRRASVQIVSPERGRAQWISQARAPGPLLWNAEPTPPALPGEPAPERRDLLLRAYYVATAADGDASTPALRMKSLTSIAGTPAFIDTEVMPGVEDLQVEPLPSAVAPRQLRITLRIQGEATTVRSGAARPRLTVTRHFTLRNGAWR